MRWSHFYRVVPIERKISFVLVFNLPRSRPISMGQMAVQIIGLSLFLVLVFCVAMTAVGEGSDGPKAEFMGHSLPSFTSSNNR